MRVCHFRRKLCKYIRVNKVARKSITLCKTSEKKIQSFIKKVNEFITEDFEQNFNKLILYDIKNIRDCSEKTIVDFYIETASELITAGMVIDENFYETLKITARSKLVNKYTNKNFDNNIDIYFNDVKKEYITHPQAECDDLEFNDENKDIFIKNNLKLVIECAKRYQNLGLPFDDLIQAGNYGLMVAFEKFDKNRANLRNNIIKDIHNFKSEHFTNEEVTEIIKRNFAYPKNLEKTLTLIPKNGFDSKEEFINWSKKNIKSAVFASVAFQWIRAYILIEINKYGKIIHIPSSLKKELGSTSIIRLDSINPYTDDNYTDNTLSSYINEEYQTEDETYVEKEKQERLADIVDELLECLPNIDRRIIKKKFGIGYPYPMTITDISESENLPSNKVKYSINNTMKILADKSKNSNLYNELFS